MKQYNYELRREDGKWTVYHDGKKLHEEVDEYEVFYAILRRMKDNVNCSFGYDYIQLDEGEV